MWCEIGLGSHAKFPNFIERPSWRGFLSRLPKPCRPSHTLGVLFSPHINLFERDQTVREYQEQIASGSSSPRRWVAKCGLCETPHPATATINPLPDELSPESKRHLRYTSLGEQDGTAWGSYIESQGLQGVRVAGLRRSVTIRRSHDIRRSPYQTPEAMPERPPVANPEPDRTQGNGGRILPLASRYPYGPALKVREAIKGLARPLGV